MTDLHDIEEGALSLEYECGCHVMPLVRDIMDRTNWTTTDDVKAHAICAEHRSRVWHLRILTKIPKPK